jgi:outer membrane cobalamin receptor
MHFSRRPLFAALLLALPAISVHSQQADTDVLEEIIVTANYRETSLMNSVGSISVL